MVVFLKFLAILLISIGCESDLQVEADLNNAQSEMIEEDSKLSEYVSINPEDICNDVTLINRAGKPQKGERDCAIDIADKNCTVSGEKNCFIGTEGSFLAEDILKASDLKSGLVIGNITGSLAETHKECTQNFETNCLANSSYRSINITNLESKNIKFGVSIAGYTGTVVASPQECNENSEIGCVTTTTYKAADLTNLINTNIKSGVNIAGITGNADIKPADCSSNGEINCVATSSYKAADFTNIIAGNIKSGVTAAGVSGDFPSATYPLTGASATADLSSAGFNASMASASSFEFWTSAGVRQTGSGDTDLAANNVKNSIAMFGVTGAVTESPANCSSDGQTGCVSVNSFKAADMSNVTAGTIKSGITIAGVSGDFPSATYPLAGASATADLSSAGFNTSMASASSFEFWTSAGVRQTGSGDSDLAANNVKNSIAMFGITGSVTESPANCSSDGEINCVSINTFKAADMSNVTAGTIKSGTTIAGISGDFPSATYPLTGASATADLSSAGFNASMASASSFEFWTSAGVRQTGSGDTDLAANNIKNSTAMFGVTGSVTESPANCSSDGETNCVSINTFKAADMTNVTAGSVKSGTTIAGVSGDFPSATYPLTGATATPDLTLFTTQLTTNGSFEYWDSKGVRNTGSGDSDIVASSVLSGTQFENLSLTGTVSSSPSVQFKNISGGEANNCGLNSSGKAYCWGYNMEGQLGIGSTGNQPNIVAVSGGLEFSSLIMGRYHSCGLLSSGQAYCWGWGSAGRLGNGSTSTQLSPTSVSGGYNFASLYPGGDHTCGLLPTGQAYCWGSNNYGQLGTGNNTDQSTPVLVSGSHIFVSMASGLYHTCGLKASGSVYCWGRGNDGQLGTGNTSNRNTPGIISGGHIFKSIVTGDHTCALTSAGNAYCWGMGINGELGTGSTTSSSVPVAVTGGHLFTYLSLGRYHSCGITSPGSIYCWGKGDGGQIGNGNTANVSSPTLVDGGYKFSQLSTGGIHTCGLQSNGQTYCWGNNYSGSLGNGASGSSTNQSSPVKVVQ